MNKPSITMIERILAQAPSDIYQLAGPRNKDFRQDVIHTYTGKRPLRAHCGINQVQEALIKHYKIPTNATLREIHRNLYAALRKDRDSRYEEPGVLTTEEVERMEKELS